MDNTTLLLKVDELEKQLTIKDNQLSQKESLIIKLTEQVKILELLHYGKKSEKMTREDALTGSLFNEAEDSVFSQQDCEQIELVKKTTEVPSHTRKTHKKVGRKPFDESLPREEIVCDLSDEEKICACNKELKFIGEDVTERLKIIPAKISIVREIRKKYVCENCEGLERDDEKGLITAEGEKHLISGSMADESLLAWSISEKFEFGLPFYRQAIRLDQIGAPIPRATLSNLTISTGLKCEPLYKLLRKSILSGQVINADETRVQVLKEPGRDNRLLSWMWVFKGGPPGKECVLFQYEQSRAHDVPYDFLKGYTGLLQTDDYEAYHTAVRRLKNEHKSTIKHFLCWAHVRRLFYRYWEISKDTEAKAILDYIKELFELEDLRKQFSPQGFLKQRIHKSQVIFSSLWQKLSLLFSQTPGKLAFGKAIAYTLDNWTQLISYVDHYELTPSNNSAERAIRPFVIGRKNWLFSGSPAGAKSSAILYSLVESAKLHGLKPYEYLLYIFKQIPFCKNDDNYFELLPCNIKPELIHI